MLLENQTSGIQAQQAFSLSEFCANVQQSLQNKTTHRMYWLEQVEHSAAAMDDFYKRTCVTCLSVAGTHADSLGFSVLMGLVQDAFVAVLADEQEATWLRTVASEIVFLLPHVKEHPLFAQAPVLETIAVAPSRRRLHKESEQMFRVTQLIVTLLLKYASRFEHGVVYQFEHLERMDEHTLRVIARLAKCIGPAPVVIIASVFAPQDARDRFASVVDAEGHLFLERAAIRSALLETIAEKTSAVICQLKDVPATASTNVQVMRDVAADHPERIKTLAFEQQMQEGTVRDIEQAILELLEASVFTQNYDHSLAIIAQVWHLLPDFSAEKRVEVLNHLAICHAYMGDYVKAIAAFEYAGRFVESPLQAAENKFFRALLYTKRLNDSKTGRENIGQALELLVDEEGELVNIERTWLHNLRALTYVNEKNRAAAYENCLQALEYIKDGHRSSDAIHIKINLISNITVLHEYGKELPRAINKWMFFERFLQSSGPVFAMHYYYRKGGLQFKNEQIAAAVQSLEMSYQYGIDLHASFYKDVIARGLAGIHFLAEDFVAAADWYQKSIDAKGELLQEDDLPKVVLARALCFLHLDRVGEAEAILHDVLLREPIGVGAERAQQVLARWGELDASDIEELIAYAIEKPDTKLNRAFDLTNLY